MIKTNDFLDEWSPRSGTRRRVYLSLRMQMLNANAKFVTPSFEWSLEWRGGRTGKGADRRHGHGRGARSVGRSPSSSSRRASGAVVFAYNYVVVAVVPSKYRTR